MPRHRQTPWRKDPAILARLPEVERRHLAGQPNTAIAAVFGVDEATIRADLKRIAERWLEHIGERSEALRSEVVAELEDVRRRALRAAEFDEMAERAVLYGVSPGVDHCLGDGSHMLHSGDAEDGDGLPVWCSAPHEAPLRVQRDDKGSASFKGSKAQSLNTARQASMDKAKVLGLIVERQDITSDGTSVFTLRIDRGDSGADAGAGEVEALNRVPAPKALPPPGASTLQ